MQGQLQPSRPQIVLLPDGRLHLQHGPIDLVIGARGAAADLARAREAAAARFDDLLGELVQELPLLRRPLVADEPPIARSPVALRMIAACWPHRAAFITPMAAVAGAVADEIAGAMLHAAPELAMLHVNNGGDIAVHLAEGEILRIGLVSDLARAAPEGMIALTAADGVGGVATSGWRGRSFSLGIADAATVLARSAAEADAAATMVGNAIDVADPAVRRAPARSLDPDSDLGDRLVTVDVGPLALPERTAAIAAGLAFARGLVRSGLILGAAAALQGEIAVEPAGSARPSWQALPFGGT